MSVTESLPAISNRSGRLREFRALALVTLSFVAVAIRLFLFIHKNAVNILFWDQWDLYEALFRRVSWWETFRWQHGPHRQGIGFVFDRFLASYSQWNTRWEAFLVFGVVVLSALAALVLKVRLFGKLQDWDVVIPFIFFTPMQYEIFLGTVNPSHAAVPVLLLLLYCLAWLCNRIAPRYLAILILDFLAVYTGFGIFVGVITPVLIGADVWAALEQGDRPYLLHSVFAFLFSVIWLVSFFIDYRYWPAVDCLNITRTNVTVYPQFAGLMLINFFGWKGPTVLPAVAGTLLLLLLLSVGISQLWRLFRGHVTKLDKIVVALIAFTTIFALTGAVGRVCSGMDHAQGSRYIPHVATGILGLYFYFLSIEERRFRLPLVAVLVLACIHGTLRLPSIDQQTARWLVEGKRNWKACYLKTQNIAVCDASTRFQIYPLPEKSQLKEKLEFLRAHRLNLYAPE